VIGRRGTKRKGAGCGWEEKGRGREKGGGGGGLGSEVRDERGKEEGRDVGRRQEEVEEGRRGSMYMGREARGGKVMKRQTVLLQQ